MTRNPLLTREYYQALQSFYRTHKGQVPKVIKPGNLNRDIRMETKRSERNRRIQKHQIPRADLSGPSWGDGRPASGIHRSEIAGRVVADTA